MFLSVPGSVRAAVEGKAGGRPTEDATSTTDRDARHGVTTVRVGTRLHTTHTADRPATTRPPTAPRTPAAHSTADEVNIAA